MTDKTTTDPFDATVASIHAMLRNGQSGMIADLGTTAIALSWPFESGGGKRELGVTILSRAWDGETGETVNERIELHREHVRDLAQIFVAIDATIEQLEDDESSTGSAN